MKAANVVPVSDFRQDAAAIINRVAKTKEPLVITRRGRAAAVLISAEEHDRAEHEREILYALARGEADIAAGRTRSLEDVLAEADKILAKE